MMMTTWWLLLLQLQVNSHWQLMLDSPQLQKEHYQPSNPPRTVAGFAAAADAAAAAAPSH